ncbi:MAG TPA: BlaI/MecI/CopY family transcriptional regulator [Gemmatimonadaceae bacterium]|nr:BlaI/MecI/CopY family transcriptional regulator [Gemmatimonadaceae bacterium]
MAKDTPPDTLGRRERQIMDIVHRLGSVSVADVRAALADPPTYSAVRGMLKLLEDKGHLTHQADGLRYVYTATVSRAAARKTALRHLVRTFFGGSASEAAASLLETSDTPLSAADAARLAAIIRDSKGKGR